MITLVCPLKKKQETSENNVKIFFLLFAHSFHLLHSNFHHSDLFRQVENHVFLVFSGIFQHFSMFRQFFADSINQIFRLKKRKPITN